MVENRGSGLRSRSIGGDGEQIAADFLKKKGHSIVEKNYRRPWGEIDIITIYGDVVHIIEVKAMEVADFSRERAHDPQELVDRRKLRKVVRTASFYMENNRDTREYQIDVIAVLMNYNTRTARCTYIEQVLEDTL